MRTIICLGVIIACALQTAPAKNSLFNIKMENSSAASISTSSLKPAMPDLIVRGNEFEFVRDKMVNVYVSNNGDAASQACRLELTIRKIGNANVGRVKKAVIPAIQPGKYVRILVDATSILPKNVSLKDTTFKVVADSSNINTESNEDNNEKWHNLN